LYCDFAFEYNIHYTRINTPLYFLSKKTLPYINKPTMEAI
jgi:hypothetical protein